MKRGDADHGKKGRKSAAPSGGGAPQGHTVKQGSYLALSTRPAAYAGADAAEIVSDVLRPVMQAKAIAATVAAVGPVLQLGVASLDINESLHRLDADVQVPSLEQGLRSANRIGEPLASIAMRWTLAPDDFVATPGAEPPRTGFRNATSQRFVMQDGTITFLDRSGSAIRFFGAGRTYPATTDGQQRLMFAGTATVVEGIGALKGLRGRSSSAATSH